MVAARLSGLLGLVAGWWRRLSGWFPASEAPVVQNRENKQLITNNIRFMGYGFSLLV